PTAVDPIIMIQHQVTKCNVAGGLSQRDPVTLTRYKSSHNSRFHAEK
ncbi:unnamed protein product, partial [Rotaria socialis]